MLFDAIERTEAIPARRQEDSFSFLNRAAGAPWERIRVKLDEWYAAFSDPDEDLRSRFRSRAPQQHYAAWWELYLHAVFSALGYQLTVHPMIPATTRRTDFLAQRGDESFYIEGKTSFSGIVPRERQPALGPEIEDIINTIDASTFYVTLKWERLAGQMPGRRAITEPIEKWLAKLDPDEVGLAGSWKQFEFGDCILSLRPGAWKPEPQGCPDNPFIGSHLGFAGFVNDVLMIRESVRDKGSAYSPDKPLVIAVLAMNGFVSDREVTDALFGGEAVQLEVATGATRIVPNRDGAWIGRSGAAGGQGSAVLMGVGILPHTIARAWPRLWYHFDPAYPLKAELPFSSARVVDEKLQIEDATRSPAEVLEVPADWPGPEPLFSRCQDRPGDHGGGGPVTRNRR